ncbi:TPA: hypothetical protein JAJ78_000206 [Corynebacterium striatum]|nr:hypothetical protein [Corynebacterium striatum]
MISAKSKRWGLPGASAHISHTGNPPRFRPHPLRVCSEDVVELVIREFGVEVLRKLGHTVTDIDQNGLTSTPAEWWLIPFVGVTNGG